MLAVPEARRVDLGDVTLSLLEAGAGPAVVMCHGFPETAYSWRHQLPALAEAGFRAIAPNQRGYADSTVLPNVQDYDLVHLTDDMARLLDALAIERAVFAGHDWGGFVTWAMPLRFPDRCLGVIGVNTPYVPFPGTDVLRRAFGDDEKLYILWFQEPGVAEAALDRNPRLVFQQLMCRGVDPGESAGLFGGALLGEDANPFRRLETLEPIGPPLLAEEELEHYARAFQQSGFFGPVSWYRNIDRNNQLLPDLGLRKLALPCLQICAAWDFALPPAMAAGMPALCSDLEMHTIDACGHWTQQEQPEELNRLMIDWLTRRFS
jgi:pimeloyl-ACP methyl ester carboxylesterase